jgi:hypothetical protein
MRRSTWAALAVVLIALAVGVFAVLSFQDTPPTGGTSPSAPSGTAPNAAPPPAPNGTPVPAPCPTAAVTVTTAAELTQALGAAAPGTVIILADGVYHGNFRATGAGTPGQPITLCGGTGAILDGGGTDEGYVLHLDRASHWTVQGFTVRNGQKGVMVDEGTHVLLQGLTVENTGDEAIHLRRFSSDNKVTGNTIRGAGLRKPKFGEGIYIGTAESNWCDITACKPDKSDRNEISGNTVSGTTAESVDIKEGTSDGLLAGNIFDGSAMTEADSWASKATPEEIPPRTDSKRTRSLTAGERRTSSTTMWRRSTGPDSATHSSPRATTWSTAATQPRKLGRDCPTSPVPARGNAGHPAHAQSSI